MANPFKKIGSSAKEIFVSFKNSTKREKNKAILNIFLLIFGSVLIAFGTAIFLIPSGIPAGGLSGAGVVIQYLVPSFEIEYFVLICTWIFFVVGWILLGTRFAFRTLISTIIYPLALLLFSRVAVFTNISDYLRADSVTVIDSSGNSRIILDNVQILLNGLFGGALVGTGVSLTFLGGGSSGGVDVLYFILAKYARIRQSVSSFVIDGAVILTGIIIKAVGSGDEIIIPFIGIISVFVGAMMIEYIYIRKNSAYYAEIISERWEEISDFIQNDIERGVTIVPVVGGYLKEEKVMLRVVFDQSDYQAIKTRISQIDPSAFVTYTRTEAVFGEGFTPHRNSRGNNSIKPGNTK